MEHIAAIVWSMPQDIEAAYQSAVGHHRSGRTVEAEQLYRQVLKARPGHAGALHYMGLIAHQAGKNETALKLLEKSVRASPPVGEYFANYAGVFAADGQLKPAEENLRRAIELEPRVAIYRHYLADTLRALGQPEEAAKCYREALGLDPEFAAAHANLGNALMDGGQPAEAEGCFRRALELKPDHAEIHHNLGTALKAQTRLDGALESFQAALRLNPRLAPTLVILANTLKEQARVGEAEKAYRQALEIAPNYAEAHSNLLLVMHYDAGRDGGQLRREAEEWDRRYAGKDGQGELHGNDRSPDRPLRVGYVSGDFRRHPVGLFMAPVISGHDKRQFNVVCYNNDKWADELTEKLKSEADGWRDIAGLDDDDACRLIRDDAIDILVDLSGHSAGGRLGVFALKPAPVQFAYLGYPGTTGLKAVDYRITDGRADPEPDADRHFTEKLVRLPGGFLCYAPVPDAPGVSPPPLIGNGYPTFGSFNNLAKLSADVIGLWAGILKAVPSSRLLLKNQSFADAATQARIAKAFADRGVEGDRLELVGPAKTIAEHLGLYGRVDIALDPFPYNGTTTTCEALWMGTPVVVLAGDRHSGRVGASILGAAGLTDFVAGSPEQYVELAVAWAGREQDLAALRESLRQRVGDSDLTNQSEFVANLEAAYRETWRQWCRTSGSEQA